MTARADRRRRRGVVGLVVVIVLVLSAGALVAFGVFTLLDSEAGRAVEVDERPVVVLPATPNGVLAVADERGRLTSVVVATLAPEGVGGSIAAVAVNADADAGFGEEPVPLDTVFDADDPESLRTTMESMLGLTIERVGVATDDDLADLVGPLGPVVAELPADVVDSDGVGTGVVASAGRASLPTGTVTDSLLAVDTTGAAYDHHRLDVAIWSALAEAAPVADGVDAPSPDDPPPASIGDLFEALWSGPVAVRDLALAAVVAADSNPPAVDAVVLDRRDVLLVFTQVSPSLVARPGEALSFRMEARYNETQLEASEGLFESNSELMRRAIGELLFFQANPVSTAIAPAEEGAPSITRIEVADPRFVDDMELLAEPLFGPSEIVVASTVIQGIDVVVELGTGYIDLRVEDEARSNGGESAATGAGGDDGSGDSRGDDSPDGGAAAGDGAEETGTTVVADE